VCPAAKFPEWPGPWKVFEKGEGLHDIMSMTCEAIMRAWSRAPPPHMVHEQIPWAGNQKAPEAESSKKI